LLQNDLKRKLRQVTKEAAKTRKKFAETLKSIREETRESDIRQSQETLNKSTKAGKKRKTTASKKTRTNKKKTATKKKPTEEDDSSTSLSSVDEPSKKTTPKKKTPSKPTGVRDTTSISSEDEATKKAAPKKKTPSKKTPSKKTGLMDKTSLSSDDDLEDLEGATIKKHSYDSDMELYTVQVSWKKSKEVGWQFLHDMWVDYPEEVKKYRDRNRLTASAWQVPKIDGVSFVVRILSMNGTIPLLSTFSILFDNGYVEKEAKLSNVKTDAPELLEKFLRERVQKTSS
jgi:hypothetical protein